MITEMIYRFTCLCAGVSFGLLLAGCSRAPNTSGSRDALAKLSVIKAGTSHYVDSINDVQKLDGVAHVPARGNMTVSGWAVDTPNAQLAAAVWIDIDGMLYQAQYGNSRPDVAAVLKVPAYATSGFKAVIPASDIASGLHRLTLKIVNHDGSGYYLGQTVQFDYR
jgi:hypothetical protein